MDDAEPGLPPAVAVSGASVLTVLLTVWASFLVPLRVGSAPVPLWLLPLLAMLGLAVRTARTAGLAGALVPAVLWLGVSWIGFGSTRAEGDLVVPGTASGYAYLFGGVVLWLLVVGRAATPRAPSGR